MVEAIQRNTIVRLGTKEQRAIRCRIIFIFNRPATVLVKEGRLIFTLSKYLTKYQTIELLPLKKRKEDIPELAQHFFTQFQILHRKKIDHKFIKLLLKHKWEMNILSLKSFIKTLYMPPDDVAIQQKDKIELAKMSLMIDEGKEFSLKDSVLKIENDIAWYALSRHGNNQAKTALSIGITNRSIGRFVKSK